MLNKGILPRAAPQNDNRNLSGRVDFRRSARDDRVFRNKKKSRGLRLGFAVGGRALKYYALRLGRVVNSRTWERNVERCMGSSLVM